MECATAGRNIESGNLRRFGHAWDSMNNFVRVNTLGNLERGLSLALEKEHRKGV